MADDRPTEGGDREGLAKGLHDYGLCVEVPSIEGAHERHEATCHRFADAILASGWLRDHNAAVRREVAEEIAAAIEAFDLGTTRRRGDVSAKAASIAREVGERMHDPLFHLAPEEQGLLDRCMDVVGLLSQQQQVMVIQHALRVAIVSHRDPTVLSEFPGHLLDTMRLHASPVYRQAVADARPPNWNQSTIDMATLLSALGEDKDTPGGDR